MTYPSVTQPVTMGFSRISSHASRITHHASRITNPPTHQPTNQLIMKRILKFLATFIGVLALLLLGLYLFRKPLIEQLAPRFGVRPPTGAAAPTDLSLPAGFVSSIFAEGLDDPRFMTVGADSTLFVAERGASRVIALPDQDGDGQADEMIVIADGFERPSSVIFRPGTSELYVGERPRVTRLLLDGFKVIERDVVIPDLPAQRGHHTTTVLFDDADKLYVSVGSTCNVCEEEDPRLATVWLYNADGSNGRLFMKGLRNAVGLARNPLTGEIWASNNGRDLMGDDIPPETVYILQDGADAGWPYCHAGDIPDPDYGSPPSIPPNSGGEDDACAGVTAPVVKMQAHAAPLGLTFYDASLFPAEYQGDLFIALHGSWNRSIPVGYQILRVPIDNGQVAGEVEAFATGWLLENLDSTGRPVDVVVAADGALLVSDDKAGLIYRIAPQGQ
jgi:glucose/arabinose dehydrogenase